MADQPEKTYFGTIINFGIERGGKGRGFGFVSNDDGSIADAFFNMNMLERMNFPIPKNATLLNGLHVKYTIKTMPDNALRVTSIELDGELNYQVRAGWQSAAPEVGTRTTDNHPDMSLLHGSDPAPATRKTAPATTEPEQTGQTVTGTVKWYNVSKAFGFIIPDDGGEDVLVHVTNVADGVRLLENHRVSFTRVANIRKGVDKGFKVRGLVTLLDSAEAGMQQAVVKQLPHAEVFKVARLEVVTGFEGPNGNGILVEHGKDASDPANHIQVSMETLKTYPFPNIEDGVSENELLTGMVYWKNPQTGYLVVLPKIYEAKIADFGTVDAQRPAGQARKTNIRRDRAPGDE